MFLAEIMNAMYMGQLQEIERQWLHGASKLRWLSQSPLSSHFTVPVLSLGGGQVYKEWTLDRFKDSR